MDANLAVLRHYNFSPEQANITTTAKILILAQMRLPEHDFSQMLHLIPERVQVHMSRRSCRCQSWRHWPRRACMPAHVRVHDLAGAAQEEQPVAALIVLSQHLEGARFQAFWQAADACKDVVGSVCGYYDAVRAYILTVITSTCQKASKAMVAESLRLDAPQLEALVRRPCLRTEGVCGELFWQCFSRAVLEQGTVLPGAG